MVKEWQYSTVPCNIPYNVQTVWVVIGTIDGTVGSCPPKIPMLSKVWKRLLNVIRAIAAFKKASAGDMKIGWLSRRYKRDSSIRQEMLVFVQVFPIVMY